jgi:hypothetical protein
MEKQGGMAFGFWKTATAVIKLEREIGSMVSETHISFTFWMPEVV